MSCQQFLHNVLLKVCLYISGLDPKTKSTDSNKNRDNNSYHELAWPVDVRGDPGEPGVLPHGLERVEQLVVLPPRLGVQPPALELGEADRVDPGVALQGVPQPDYRKVVLPAVVERVGLDPVPFEGLAAARRRLLRE